MPAMSRASCVATMRVAPTSPAKRQAVPPTAAPASASRLAVGSSATRMCGRATSARATATRCIWPRESVFHLLPGARDATPASRRLASSRRVGASRNAARRCGSSTFSSAERRGTGESPASPPDMRGTPTVASPLAQRPMSVSPQTIRPAGGAIEPGEQVDEGGLAGTEGPVSAAWSPAGQVERGDIQRRPLQPRKTHGEVADVKFRHGHTAGRQRRPGAAG